MSDSDGRKSKPSMKILLIRPPARFVSGAIPPSASLPLGIMSIAAVLEEDGHQVAIFDAMVEGEGGVRQDPGGFNSMGAKWEEVAAAVGRLKPDLVGISCLFSAQMANAVLAAELVKRIDPRIVTVMGGSHPSARPHDFFTKTSAVDVVCRGEGEYTLRELVHRLSAGGTIAGTPGTLVRERDEIIEGMARPFIADLDALPLPAYHLVDMELYFRLFADGNYDRPTALSKGSPRVVSVITSRGCPFNCLFCSVHLHMGRRWRYHSAAYVTEHLRVLVLNYGVRHFHFEDDNISCDPKRFLAILDGIAGLPYRVTWDTPNGVRLDTLSWEIVFRCAETGCTYLTLGVESGSQHVLDTIIEKSLDLNLVETTVAWCVEAGVDVRGFFVVGFPGETREQMEETVSLALSLQRRYGLSPHLFIATPLPGTRLEAVCLERGLLPAPLAPDTLAAMTQGAVPWKGDTFSATDIHELWEAFSRGYRQNFIAGSIRFLVRYPGLIPTCIRNFCFFARSNSLRVAFIKTFDFKCSLVRGRYGRGGMQG